MKLIDATETVAGARECIRCLWNQHYLLLADTVDAFDLIEGYERIRRQILLDFLSLRFGAIDAPLVSIENVLDPRYVFVAENQQPGVTRWQPLQDAEIFRGKLFAFEEFFDFREYGLVDLKYVKLGWLSDKTSAVGQQPAMLAEFGHCSFYVRSKNDAGG